MKTYPHDRQHLMTLGRARQQGVALFIALMILVIISVLGIASLRTSATNARIATGIQVNTVSFQAAQSAINAVVNEMVGPTAGQAGNILNDMIAARGSGVVAIQTRCVTAADTAVAGACDSADSVDSKGLVKAGSRSILRKAMRPAPGWSLSGPGSYGYNSIMVVGSGAVPSMGVSNLNVQELALLGPKPQGEL